ncbi:LuxR C-terminal-related transcriptional regulator, partial [Kitasatospora sp. NPDC058263]
LVVSRHVQQLYARELLADGTGGVGYLLKDRVFNADQFIDAVRRVAAGGTAMDPDVIAKLVQRTSRRPGALHHLSPREREVLELMAEGCSNSAIAARLVVSDGAVAKHIANIFTKLGLAPADDANRRVQAVLAYLNGTAGRPA